MTGVAVGSSVTAKSNDVSVTAWTADRLSTSRWSVAATEAVRPATAWWLAMPADSPWRPNVVLSRSSVSASTTTVAARLSKRNCMGYQVQ